MNRELSDEASELGEVVRDALRDVGGVNLLRRAALDPSVRAEVRDVLDPIGVWELSPASDQLEFELAAAVSRAAGAFGTPYPVVERLGRVGEADATVLTSTNAPRTGMHLDLPLSWTAIDLRGTGYRAAGRGPLLRTQLAPFGVEFDAIPNGSIDQRGAATLLVLQAWWLLGLIDDAHNDTVQYAREREQFGRTIAHFQAVGFMLADALLAVRSFEELAKYTLWSVANSMDASHALTDAIALRVAGLDAAEFVMRTAHQLHGAMGFTDEVDLSWLSKASQGPRRLPEGRHATEAALLERMGRDGLHTFGRVRAISEAQAPAQR